MTPSAARLRDPLVDRVAARSARAAEDLGALVGRARACRRVEPAARTWIESWLGAIRPVGLRAPTTHGGR
jgi:hypothetical protein